MFYIGLYTFYIGFYTFYIVNDSYARTLMIVDLIVVDLFSLFNFTRNGFLLLDHLWTQDSLIVPQICDYKMGPYIDT